MRRTSQVWLAPMVLLLGCGGLVAPRPAPVEIGPHRGRLLKLPDNLGLAEVVVESASKSPNAMTNPVAAYFYGPDARTPLAPAPTDVAIRLYFGESRSLEKVALKPAEGPQGPGKFSAVPPPGFDGNIRTGRLFARYAGQDIDLPF